MVSLKIYDPAMCCSSGVCGPNVNDKLVQLAAFLKGLNEEEYAVERYNLSQQPEAYVESQAVADNLKDKGTEVLPLIFVDDELMWSGDYPPVKELADALKTECPDADRGDSGCCPGSCC